LVIDFYDGNAGVLPAQAIRGLADKGLINSTKTIENTHIQPASLDMRLGTKAWRVRASFLPGKNCSVSDKLGELALHEVDLQSSAVLETGCVYVVRLQESLSLPEDISAVTNPKSSTGRLDVFTRIIVDKAQEFDQIECGYSGPLYAEICPQTFPVLVRTGSRLSQIRFRKGKAIRNAATGGVDGIALSVDISGNSDDGLVGYRGKRHTGVVDVDKPGAYDLLDYWEPIYQRGDRRLVLDPNEFYILASKEAVQVPEDEAAEMIAFNPLVGEFRVHYAGFFDPGFGMQATGGAGSRAVLEVRNHEVPFILEDGQVIGRLVYEKLLASPSKLYGTDIGSHYQSQGLKLSKHFR
jgi:dCTP deaminase